MKTFAEKQGALPFDWNEFLNREKISDEEWCNAVDLSRSWVTCACGNQCCIIERDEDDYNAPVDKVLKELGIRFYENIKDKNFPTAKETLIKIEIRSLELIEEIKKDLGL